MRRAFWLGITSAGVAGIISWAMGSARIIVPVILVSFVGAFILSVILWGDD